MMINSDHLRLNVMLCFKDDSLFSTLTCCLDFAITVLTNIKMNVKYICVMGRMNTEQYVLAVQFVTSPEKLYCMGLGSGIFS